MTRKQQQDFTSLLGATIAQKLNQPYSEGANGTFALSWRKNTCTIAVVIHPDDEDIPHIEATVTSWKKRVSWFRLICPCSQQDNVALISNTNAVGHGFGPSAMEQMGRWPTDLHPRLRAIFVELCEELDKLRQPTAG